MRYRYHYKDHSWFELSFFRSTTASRNGIVVERYSAFEGTRQHHITHGCTPPIDTHRKVALEMGANIDRDAAFKGYRDVHRRCTQPSSITNRPFIVSFRLAQNDPSVQDLVVNSKSFTYATPIREREFFHLPLRRSSSLALCERIYVVLRENIVPPGSI